MLEIQNTGEAKLKNQKIFKKLSKTMGYTGQCNVIFLLANLRALWVLLV